MSSPRKVGTTKSIMKRKAKCVRENTNTLKKVKVWLAHAPLRHSVMMFEIKKESWIELKESDRRDSGILSTADRHKFLNKD
jgi:hypothetical protein